MIDERAFQEMMRRRLEADEIDSIEWVGDELPLKMTVRFTVGTERLIEVACPAPMPPGFCRRLEQHRRPAGGVVVLFHLQEDPERQQAMVYPSASMRDVVWAWAEGHEPERARRMVTMEWLRTSFPSLDRKDRS